jgi:hypothetical protein
MTIYPCGKELVFTANTDPPGHEEEIEWEVPINQNQTSASGTGSTFSTSWTETGVKQVRATIGDSGDDLILYLFKTKTGRVTLGDVLDRFPPPIDRTPRDYEWFRERNVGPTDVEA